MFNPGSPQAQGYINNYANQYYNEAVAPTVAQLQTNNFQTGMENSSSGGAEVGQAAAQGAVASNLEGINAYEGLLGGMNNTAANYFSGPGQLANNSVSQANNLDTNIFGTKAQIYGQQLGVLDSALGGGSKALTGGLGGGKAAAQTPGLGGGTPPQGNP